MANLMNVPNVPGLEVLGCGYQTVTGEFASIYSCKERLFDFTSFGYTELHSAATGNMYRYPTFVQFLDKNFRYSGDVVTGETVEDFIKNLSASVEIEAVYAGFGGTIKAEFGEASVYSRFDTYSRSQYNVSLWRLKLDEDSGNSRNFLLDGVRSHIDNLPPNELYDKYGTHYVNDITVGGRCVTSSVTKRLTNTMKYNNVKTTGGNPSAYGSNNNLEEWAQTVKDFPEMIDIDSRQGLLPIWKLAGTDERKRELKDAMNEYFKNHKISFNVPNDPVFDGRWVDSSLHFSDAGSGARLDFRAYKPNVTYGWYWLGHSVSSGKGLLVRPKPWAEDALCGMSDFSRVWHDAGSGKSKDYRIFRPVPEHSYYRSLGDVFTVDSNPNPSDFANLKAVHHKFTTETSLGGLIWNDAGTGADQDGSIWRIAVPHDGLDCDFWYGSGSHSRPPGMVPYCIKKSAIEFI